MADNKNNVPSKVWIVADTHLGHKNIIKHCPHRAVVGGFDIDDMAAHDEWLINIWNTTVNKHDTVYIIGDFSFHDRERTIKLLNRLHGKKHLILGNHDKSSYQLENYFVSISLRKEVTFKKECFDFLLEDFGVVFEHYPMLVWNKKHYGIVQMHGHSHGRLDDFNANSFDLRIDFGFDGRLANYNLVSLEKAYNAFKTKAQNMLFSHYANEKKTENMLI